MKKKTTSLRFCILKSKGTSITYFMEKVNSLDIHKYLPEDHVALKPCL